MEHWRLPFLTPPMLIKAAVACAGDADLERRLVYAAGWHTLRGIPKGGLSNRKYALLLLLMFTRQ